MRDLRAVSAAFRVRREAHRFGFGPYERCGRPNRPTRGSLVGLNDSAAVRVWGARFTMNVASSSLVMVEVPVSVPPVPVRWLRVPRSGEACPFSSLGHGYVYSKLLGAFSELFVHVSLRSCGESRGTQLMLAPSVHRLLVAASEGLDAKAKATLQEERFSQAAADQPPARWQRVPPNGIQCDFTGLSHGAFYELLERAGKGVRVAQLRMPEERRATRLVWLPSLHEYLLRLASAQANAAVSTAA